MKCCHLNEEAFVTVRRRHWWCFWRKRYVIRCWMCALDVTEL